MEACQLAEVLARFDRKERRRLIERALGGLVSTSVADSFICKINEELGLSLSAGVQWFMDYHIDWLVGAAWIYQVGYHECSKPQSNESKLVVGNQEDFDLLLAESSVVVCIEAKWFDAWDECVLEKKVQRAKAAFDSAEEFARRKGHPVKPVRLHFAKLSLSDAGDRKKLMVGRHPDRNGHEFHISPAGTARGGPTGKLVPVYP